jgi:hypothetical protein
VQYDDGDIEEGLVPQSLLRYSRRTIYTGENVIVEDGAILVNGAIRRARLLHFRQSIGIFQSGLLMSSDRVETPDFSILPFEVNQAMLLGVALSYGLNKQKLPLKVCFLGLGGGSVPSCFLNQISPNAEIDVVDLSQEAIEISQKYFGLSPKIKVHCEDGIQFFSRKHGSKGDYDLVIIDVADANSRFLPPCQFFNRQWLRSILQKPGSVCVMNVLAERNDALEHVTTGAEVFTDVFHTSYCAVGDPNHVFFGVNSRDPVEITHWEVVEWIQSIPQLANAVPGVLRDLQTKRSRFWKRASSLARNGKG